MTWWHSFSFSTYGCVGAPASFVERPSFLHCIAFTPLCKKPHSKYGMSVCVWIHQWSVLSPANRNVYSFLFYACVLSHVGLFATLWTVAHQTPPSVEFPKKILKWIAIFLSRGSSQPRHWTQVSCISCIDRGVLNNSATWEAPFFALCKHKYMLAKENNLKKWTP